MPQPASQVEAVSLKHAHSAAALHDDHKRHKISEDGAAARRPEQHLEPSAMAPLLATEGLEETMNTYYTRLKQAVEIKACKHYASLQEGPAGLYLHKRPVVVPDGSASPLASCGSVFHHCVLYIKEHSGKVHSLDYGPANGADVTRNVMESLPARGCLTKDVDATALTDAATARSGPCLPFMYLGLPDLDLDHEHVLKAIECAEARPYNLLRNNCIHFADAMTRVLTQGRVRSVPHVYDVVCGVVQDNPAILMLQMLMRVSWMSVCDGSALFQAMVKATCQAESRSPEKPAQPALEAAAPDSASGALAMQFLAALSQAAQQSPVPVVATAPGSSEAVPSAP